MYEFFLQLMEACIKYDVGNLKVVSTAALWGLPNAPIIDD